MTTPADTYRLTIELVMAADNHQEVQDYGETMISESIDAFAISGRVVNVHGPYAGQQPYPPPGDLSTGQLIEIVNEGMQNHDRLSAYGRDCVREVFARLGRLV